MWRFVLQKEKTNDVKKTDKISYTYVKVESGGIRQRGGGNGRYDMYLDPQGLNDYYDGLTKDDLIGERMTLLARRRLGENSKNRQETSKRLRYLDEQISSL